MVKAPIQTWCRKCYNNQPRTPYATCHVSASIPTYSFSLRPYNAKDTHFETKKMQQPPPPPPILTPEKPEARKSSSLLHRRLPLPPLPRNFTHHLPQQPVGGVHVGGERLEAGDEGVDLCALGLDL